MQVSFKMDGIWKIKSVHEPFLTKKRSVWAYMHFSHRNRNERDYMKTVILIKTCHNPENVRLGVDAESQSQCVDLDIS